MEDIIKLKSGYKEENYLKKLTKSDGSESKTYVLKTDIPTVRTGELNNGSKFIDPSEAKAVVKFTDFVEGYGWAITFE